VDIVLTLKLKENSITYLVAPKEFELKYLKMDKKMINHFDEKFMLKYFKIVLCVAKTKKLS
jgi:hypothetical protein